MAGTFIDHHFVVLFQVFGSPHDAVGIVEFFGFIEIGGCSPAAKDDGAVNFGCQLKIHGLGKEQGVFIHAQRPQVEELLPYRLAIPHIHTCLGQSIDKPQGAGGFPHMLACSGYVNRSNHKRAFSKGGGRPTPSGPGRGQPWPLMIKVTSRLNALNYFKTNPKYSHLYQYQSPRRQARQAGRASASCRL